MKRAFSVMLFLVLSGGMCSTLFAAELLGVKPIVAGNTVSAEISADIAMTYTYYKVPGQARAVVDIAEVDPEKIEPLIVVNKGVVSSISVDSAQISGIVASRIIFNLVSETDFSVTASPDRKLLVVTFSGSAPAATVSEHKPGSTPEIRPETLPDPALNSAPPAVAAATAGGAQKEVPPAKVMAPAAANGTERIAIPSAPRTTKLEPVVPVEGAPPRSSSLMIKEVVTGAKYIEIRANQAFPDYKIMKLSSPARLAIDIASSKTNQRPKIVAINKFGISKVRIGVSPTNIRIVMDSSKAVFPAHSITRTAQGLRINFK